MTILYFTATGNGLYLAKQIGGELYSIPSIVKAGNYNFKDDKIGIVFPVYGIAVPQYICEFLSRVQLNSEYIFALMSYGMMAGAATTNLIEVGRQNGIHFSYINTIKMVDNYLPGFEMKEQVANAPKKEIEKHLQTIIADISAKKQWTQRDSLFDKLATKIYKKKNPYKTGVGVTNQYQVEDSCIKCGICAQVCPTDNVAVNHAKPIFGDNCISCLSCTHNCPQNAIRLESEKSTARYRNPDITVKEIIQSNM